MPSEYKIPGTGNYLTERCRLPGASYENRFIERQPRCQQHVGHLNTMKRVDVLFGQIDGTLQF